MLYKEESRGYYSKNLLKKNHYTVIETCFEMLKSSEHKILRRNLQFKSNNFEDCSEVRSADPRIYCYYKILRIGGPDPK